MVLISSPQVASSGAGVSILEPGGGDSIGRTFTIAGMAPGCAQVTIERIINLSDFSFILFEHAKCPCVLLRFAPGEPPSNHSFAYDLPKVSGADPRAGIFTIYPNERRRVRQRDVLAAAVAGKCSEFWKLPLWATPRDRQLLEYLEGFQKLESLADNPRKIARKLLFKGQGIQPDRQGRGPIVVVGGKDS